MVEKLFLTSMILTIVDIIIIGISKDLEFDDNEIFIGILVVSVIGLLLSDVILAIIWIWVG